MLKTAYMRQFLGESFDAVISSVTSFGIFAVLSNSCEGLIRCENISSDYFEYDEQRHILTGAHTGKTYKIGDGIRITVAACNVLMRRIDFVLEEDARGEVFAKIEKRNRKAAERADKKPKRRHKYRDTKKKRKHGDGR